VPSTVTVPSPGLVQLSGAATDDEGAPVSGVTVLVYPWNGPAGLGNPVTTVTDASGNYRGRMALVSVNEYVVLDGNTSGYTRSSPLAGTFAVAANEQHVVEVGSSASCANLDKTSDKVSRGEERDSEPKSPPHVTAEEAKQDVEAEDRFEASDN
jgi:hypothetical protein